MDTPNNSEEMDFLYHDVRTALNLDNETLNDVWESYLHVIENHTLSGKKTDWLACALYMSCRKCGPTTVRGQCKTETNMVSLTKILRTCNTSLVTFFHKIKIWMEFSNSEQIKKIDQIEKNFCVTAVIFRKFKPIYESIFKYPTAPCRFSSKNNRKMRKQPLTSMDVFTFCWTLFVFVKSRFSQISDDLLNSYHLLLVCIDYCFSSVLSFDTNLSIINTVFHETLSRKCKNDLKSLNNISIIDYLCEQYGGIIYEVKHIRKHWFKALLKTKIEDKELKKTISIIDANLVDSNYKYIKQEYEHFVLTVGDFDECIFLSETASEELGTPELQTDDLDIDARLYQRQQEIRAKQAADEAAAVSNCSNLVIQTPLSSKQYLEDRTPVEKVLTPITSAITSISRLQSLLLHRNEEPSKELEKLFDM